MIIKIIKIFHSIWQHPAVRGSRLRAILRYITWQFVSRLNFSDFIYNWVDDAVLVMKRSEAMVTHNYYTGLYEFEDMHFLMKYVSKEDSFVDIGANSGVYTVLAAKVLDIPTLSFEPIKSTFSRLLQNVKINKIENKVTLFNIGLSNEPGTLRFTSNLDATNHVSTNLSNFLSDKEIVSVDTIDNIIWSQKFSPTLMKIDVEGFEKTVLDGAHVLLKSQALKVILIELNDSGMKYGVTDEEVAKMIIQSGFVGCDYDYNKNRLFKNESYRSTRQNTIFVRDIEEANLKLSEKKEYRKIRILNKLI